jgi:hypothetical protein
MRSIVPGMVEQCHETAVDLVSCADFSCALHDFSSLTRRSGSLGWPNNGRKPKFKLQSMFLGMIATVKRARRPATGILV